jgi:hypothetical protein
MAGSRRSSHDAAGGAAGNPGSSLNQLAAQLPSVDHALDELISRANQVDVAAGEPGAADDFRLDAPGDDQGDFRLDDRRDDRRDPAGSQRWPAAETRLRDAEAREQALRRELEALRRRLADVEARPAIAAAPPVTGRPLPWLAIACAFAAGLAAMLAVSRLALHSRAPEPEAVLSAPQPAAAPGLEPSVTPPRPTVTPIDPLPSDPRSPSSTPASDARTAPF